MRKARGKDDLKSAEEGVKLAHKRKVGHGQRNIKSVKSGEWVR